MTNNQFPLVADGVPIVEMAKQMALYENEDLITNIHGYYQDKDYDVVTTPHQFADQLPSQKLPSTDRLQSKQVNESRNYAKESRLRARQDLKEKRQAYLAKEMTYVSKQAGQKSRQTESVSSRKKPMTELSRFTDKLHQEEYILAEIPRMYKEPNQSQSVTVKKNNYDFLKRSQIYNNKETREQREKTIAQELNLSRFEELY
ncbi:hypothetical protein ACVR0P_04325 [Streptococcus castoreus]|uniref:hypothetical protein n=1 Tax=Streptococcus castoreus TaxID=254786 RepID=UPI0003F5AA6D|nr:hypothetical protein [Streptococcus castoreus]